MLQHPTRGRKVQLGYKAARVSQEQGNGAMPVSGNYDQQFDRHQLIADSRNFYKQNNIYAGIINKMVNYVIGSGAYLQCLTTNIEWNSMVEGLWQDYWKSPVDITDRFTGIEYERLMAQEVFICGDNGTILLKDSKLQMAEAEQIRKSNRINDDNGIDTDQNQRPTKYWVAPYTATGTNFDIKNVKSYKPDDFILVGKVERASALRSVPPLQSAFPMLLRLTAALNNESDAMELVSRLAIAITRASSADQSKPIFPGITATNEPTLDEPTSGGVNMHYTNEGPVIFEGEPGDEIKSIARDIPNVNFLDAIVFFIRTVGLPMSIPLELILLDWTNSNYSQSRAVIIQAQKTFADWQTYFINTFYNRVFKRFVENLIADEVIEDIPDKFKFEFRFKPLPMLDPLKEIQAASIKMDRGLSTYEQSLKDQGLDMDNVIPALRNEADVACQIVTDLKAKYGIELPPEYFMGRTVNVALSPATPITELEDENGNPIGATNNAN